ncbi:hypothetical protein HKD37_11G032087 [Glycine soja]
MSHKNDDLRDIDRWIIVTFKHQVCNQIPSILTVGNFKIMSELRGIPFALRPTRFFTDMYVNVVKTNETCGEGRGCHRDSMFRTLRLGDDLLATMLHHKDHGSFKSSSNLILNTLEIISGWSDACKFKMQSYPQGHWIEDSKKIEP